MCECNFYLSLEKIILKVAEWERIGIEDCSISTNKLTDREIGERGKL